MSGALLTIAGELRRLQREGLERVFIDAATIASIGSMAGSAAEAQTVTRQDTADTEDRQTTRSPVDRSHTDLRSLIDKPIKRAASPPTKVQNQAASVRLPEALPVIHLPEGDAATQLASLKEQVLACPTCRANLNPRGKIVFGEGNPAADIFFCGEAPGAEEELAGKAFVGKAGQLLDKIILAMGLSREQVYIANILNWRPQHDKPHGNRPPTIEEMRFCMPYLEAQIDIVRPKLIVALGNTAVSGLLGPDPKRKMGSVRGTWHAFKATPLMITFHPSYLLRNGTLKTKRMVWEDMLEVMKRCGLPISDRQRGFFLPK